MVTMNIPFWRATDPHDLVNAAEFYLKGWRPRGRKLVAVSNSGATCVMAADMAEEFHLSLGEPPLYLKAVAAIAVRVGEIMEAGQ